MDSKPPEQPVPPNVGHPLLRSVLTIAAQIILPIAEQAIAAWLAKQGIILPLPGVSNANSNLSRDAGDSTGRSNGSGTATTVPQPPPPGP